MRLGRQLQLRVKCLRLKQTLYFSLVEWMGEYCCIVLYIMYNNDHNHFIHALIVTSCEVTLSREGAIVTE